MTFMNDQYDDDTIDVMFNDLVEGKSDTPVGLLPNDGELLVQPAGQGWVWLNLEDFSAPLIALLRATDENVVTMETSGDDDPLTKLSGTIAEAATEHTTAAVQLCGADAPLSPADIDTLVISLNRLRHLAHTPERLPARLVTIFGGGENLGLIMVMLQNAIFDAAAC